MDFKEMCRTCLRSGEMMSSIFDEEIEPGKHTAADLLAMFTSVQVDKEDCFPHNICDICLKEIQQAYLFDLKCKKSEIILHQLREIRVKLRKLNHMPKQQEIVKEDFKLEDIMNLCDRNISDESNASERIRYVEEKNANASGKLNLYMAEEGHTQDFQVAFKREPDHSNHFVKDDTNKKEFERIKILSNFQIVEEDCDPEFQITLKQELDHNSPIIRNNAGQNELELHQNPSNFEIMDDCAPEYQVIFKTEPDQNLIIKDNENEGELEFREISSNFQIADEESLPDFRATFKTEPELDIGIDYNGAELKCSACLKQFQSLDMFRGHIVSDHLEGNICKLCNEEFKCSQSEHSAKHLPLNYDEHMGIEHNEKFRHGETSKGRMTHKDELIGKSDFQCKICSKVFGFRYRLVNHMRTHTGEKPFDCELCPKKFRRSEALLCHRRTMHTDELNSYDKPVPTFQCSICYKFFGMKCLLRNHMRTHTGEKPFNCELCPEKFVNSTALLYHRRIKHTDKFISDGKPVPDFQCSVCNKVFVVKSQLRYHMRTHTGEKPYDCELCPEKFAHSTGLLRHRRTKHRDELNKPVPDFQCSICYKVFGLKCLLRNHMRTHTGEKPFDCKLCPEKFGNTTALLCHKRTKHTDKFISDGKPVSDFQCSVCNKVYGKKYALRDHMRVHTGEKPFNCELCPEKFTSNGARRCHKRTKHTDEFISDGKPVPDFQCSVCNKVFGKKYALRDHMRVHTGEKPFLCTLCPQKFRKNDALLCHSRTKHTDELISDDKPVSDFQCSVCHKVFRHKFLLREHMRTHTAEKPFDCELCPEKFGNTTELQCHKRTKHTDEFISDGKPVPDYQCSLCNKVFGKKYALRDHMLLHTGEKPFQCKSCPETFRYKIGLVCHRRAEHTNEFISDDKSVSYL